MLGRALDPGREGGRECSRVCVGMETGDELSTTTCNSIKSYVKIPVSAAC